MVCLAILVAFSMMPLSGFAASKKVIVVGEKNYSDYGNGLVLSYEYKDTYNSKGKPTVFFWTNYEIDWDTGETTGYSTSATEYKYNSKGLRTTAIEKENGKTVAKRVYSYKNNKLTKQTNYDYVNGKYVKSGYTTYKYSKSKQTITAYNSKGKVSYKYVDTLNSKGSTVTSKYYEGSGKSPASTWKYTYYADKTTVKKVVYYDASGVTTSYYNKDEKLTKDIFKGEDNSSIRREYTFDSYGREISVKSSYVSYYDGEKVTGSNVTTYKYKGTYNNNKKYPKTRLEYDEDGNLIGKTEYSYKKI